jgi:hypothetical protein
MTAEWGKWQTEKGTDGAYFKTLSQYPPERTKKILSSPSLFSLFN